MRVMVKEYAKGGRNAYETTEDGGEFLGQWAGPQQVGERIRAYVEVACDDTDDGVERLLEALTWLAEEIKKRKGKPVGV